jgi:hypothetical protein
MKTINMSGARTVAIAVLFAVLGMLSVGYVAAQTASSTEEAATSTPETPPASSGEVAGEATTTIEEVAAPEAVQEVAPTEVVPQQAISAAAAAVGDIMTLEQQYMSKYGRYLQVIPGNTLPSTESGSVQSKFGKALPENIRIDVYESPHGKGYQITYEEYGVVHSVGYGPEAGDRTYTIALPVPAVSATSTQAVQ